jgi:hypothetical protein
MPNLANFSTSMVNGILYRNQFRPFPSLACSESLRLLPAWNYPCYFRAPHLPFPTRWFGGFCFWRLRSVLIGRSNKCLWKFSGNNIKIPDSFK